MEKIAKKKARNISILFGTILMIIFFIPVLSGIITHKLIFNKNTIACFMLLLTFEITMPIILYDILKDRFIYDQIWEESEKIVRTSLSEKSIIKVIPIKSNIGHKEFITVELAKRATFYAKINENKTDIVSIFIVFNGEDEEVLFQNIPFYDFSTYYKISNQGGK